MQRTYLTYGSGCYWTEVRIPRPAVLSEEAAHIIDHRLVVDSHSLDYNPEGNLQMLIRSVQYTINNRIDDRLRVNDSERNAAKLIECLILV